MQNIQLQTRTFKINLNGSQPSTTQRIKEIFRYWKFENNNRVPLVENRYALFRCHWQFLLIFVLYIELVVPLGRNSQNICHQFDYCSASTKLSAVFGPIYLYFYKCLETPPGSGHSSCHSNMPRHFRARRQFNKKLEHRLKLCHQS